MKVLPKLNSAYWVALMAASVFGTNTGDFVAERLHLGHLTGLPWLAILLAAIFVVERVVAKGSALFFWAAIIVIRTAATNVGDAFEDFHIGFDVSLPLTVVLFAAVAVIYAMTGKSQETAEPVVRVSALYWLCMMLAGIVGTIGGDAASFKLHLMPPGTALVFGLIAVALLFVGRGKLWAQPLYYWLCLAVIRTAGTGGGDALAHALSLPVATCLSGAVFIALVLVFYALQSRNDALSPMRVQA